MDDGVLGGRSHGIVGLGEGRLRFDGTLATQGGDFRLEVESTREYRVGEP